MSKLNGHSCRKFLRQVRTFCALTLIFPVGLFAQNACDLNNDGLVNASDVDTAARMTVGLVPCTANVAGPGVCSAVVVQRVANAAVPGGTCLSHWVSLNWLASVSPSIAGYNIYRSTNAAGPFVKINPSLIAARVFVDLAVRAGQIYYYVATAVDASNLESDFSDQTIASVPSP